MMGLQTPPQPTPADAVPASVGSRVSNAPQSLELGSVVDRYRVLKALGEGAMGAVYQVEHVHMKKSFALKVLHASTMSHPEIVARFEREAHAAGQIDHPNVATATDFGKLPNGSYFLVLEYAEGRTLRTELEAGALEPRRALTLLHGVVSGVAAAHAKGIVHRDLKPENIMLVAREGNPDAVKVLDFGIAKVGAPEPEQAKASGVQALTRIGTVMGTPEYMAPEQALGGETDVRSDLYSLGVILFEMITGHVPYTGEPVVILKHHIATPIPEIPPDVAAAAGPQIVALIQRLMSKEPEGRVQTATELLTLIEDAQRGLDRVLEGSARTLLGDTALSARQSSAALPTTVQPSPLVRAERFLAGVAPPAARERLTPRQMVYAAAGIAAFVMLVPVAVVIGLATSGRGGETPEQVAAVRAAGFATTEPRVVTPVPLPPPSGAGTAAGGAASAASASAAKAAASGSASAGAGGRTAKTTGGAGKKGQPQGGGQSGGSGLNVPKEVKDFFNKL